MAALPSAGELLERAELLLADPMKDRTAPGQDWQGLEACRNDEAEKYYNRCLAGREETLGPDHPDVARSLENLVGLYRETNRTDEAEKLEERAASIRAKSE